MRMRLFVPVPTCNGAYNLFRLLPTYVHLHDQAFRAVLPARAAAAARALPIESIFGRPSPERKRWQDRVEKLEDQVKGLEARVKHLQELQGGD